MATSSTNGSSFNSRVIGAPIEAVYRAFVDPEALTVWLAPHGMSGRLHEFDGRDGRGYRMSLFYPADAEGSPGKTSELEDRFSVRFVELSSPHRIVEAITFESDDPSFAGEMRMVVTLEPHPDGTRVVIQFSGIPPGIRPEDNETGTRQSLEKLARLLE